MEFTTLALRGQIRKSLFCNNFLPLDLAVLTCSPNALAPGTKENFITEGLAGQTGKALDHNNFGLLEKHTDGAWFRALFQHDQ